MTGPVRISTRTGWFPLLLFVLTACGENTVLYSSPYPDSAWTMVFDWDARSKWAPGSDNWAMTEVGGSRHFAVWGDGGGIGGTNRSGRSSLGVAVITGNFPEIEGRNVYGGLNGESESSIDGKSYGILESCGTLFMWVSPGSNIENFANQTLFMSDDQGLSWQPAQWRFERQDGIVHPTFLQYPRGADTSTGDYVYTYAILIKNTSKLSVQRPGEIILMRTPKRRLAERAAYEFYAGRNSDDSVNWIDELNRAVPVVRDPNGVGWNMSSAFYAPLGRYLILTEHGKSMQSYLSIFASSDPWGPWETVYYGQFAGRNLDRTVFGYNIPTGWIDGLDFVMVFTGIGENDSLNFVPGSFQLRNENNEH